MTHWCNPFKTLWLGPGPLPVPPRASAGASLSDPIRRLPAISLQVRTGASATCGRAGVGALRDWQGGETGALGVIS